MKKPTVTVVGSNMVDLVTYVDRMPARGETVEAPEFELGFGGKGANQAVAAALLGARVRMVTKVGDDVFGPNTKKNLEKHGIDTTRVQTVKGVSSGVAPIFVEPDSSNSILIVKGANAHLAPADIEPAADMLADSDIVILQLEVPLETVYHTIELCAACGTRVLLNPAPADRGLDLRRLGGVTYFVPNETELSTLTGLPADSESRVEEAARLLVEAGIRIVIVTLGAKGALLVWDKGSQLVPAHGVESTDTTGAGDAFIGCFAASLPASAVNGPQTTSGIRGILAAMERANTYAALSTTLRGTQKSFSGLDRFESYLAGIQKQN